MRSGGPVRGTLALHAADMSTTAGPTLPSSLLTPEQLTVVAASFSSLVLFIVIVVLLSIIYRKDPQCCRLRSCQGPHADTDAPPQNYSSRQTLVGSACPEQGHNMERHGPQLFYVGLPSSYGLHPLEAPLPRLPSYESVRKKDRQRQIHMMIADRFGLSGPLETEPPPSYEESIRQSVELPYDILPSGLEAPPPQHVPAHATPDTRQPAAAPLGPCEAHRVSR